MKQYTRDELRKLIIIKTKEIGLFSDNAVELLIGTCAQESCLGKYRKQLGGGPALGIFQMEPATFVDIHINVLRFNPLLLKKVMKAAEVKSLKAEDLVLNDNLAVCMARVHYYRFKEAIPDNLEGWAHYWKKYYNTSAGRGTEEEFIKNYKTLCL